ncbi:PAS domain S-box protein [Arthrobacter sp. NEB 688]|uniref:PAS domain-containing sensor histidine kinase n=1 Tax=Arthrobacter sp. NEB 688 TaxID=904039 RepID=UPI00156370BE|nr:PAS domain S-box protein [Arthrobacter sp. NEB 688]QKE85554.1 PAS domain S-box protein [Arthrobacter sp. NEB 688]
MQRGASAIQALDNLAGGVFSMAPDGTILFVNDALQRTVGLRFEEAVGRNFYDLFPYARGTEIERHLTLAMESGEVQELEEFSPRVGRWLRRRIFPGPDSVTVLVDEGGLGRVEDEPNRLRHALERARNAERRYRDVLDSMADGWKETTPDGALIVVNEALATMLGYDDANQLMASVSSANELYVDPEDRARGLQSESDGRPRMIEAQMRRRDGTPVWVRSTLTPRRSPTGEVTSYRGFVEDITEQRDAEHRRREAEDRIETRERTLLAEAVHDAPLQLIVAAMLRLDGLEPQLPPAFSEPLEHVIELLRQTVERLRDLVVVLSPPVLGHGLADGLRALAQGVFAGSGTEVEVAGPARLPLRPDAENGAFRIAREALVNARRHARAEHVVVRLAHEGDAVVLTVADDGVGGAHPSSEPGHLGMTSMYSRAEGMGGTLTVDSPPDGGTTVTLSVPLDPPSDPPAPR